MKILVVEDEAAVRDLLVDILEDDGYEVHAVADGSQALAVAPELRPDLVLLDAGLPGVDGWSVARRLRQAGDVAIIFVTGSDSRESIRAGFDLGGDDYIVKPFDDGELSSRVRAVLRRTGHTVPQVWEVEGLVVDGGARTVTVNGTTVTLTTLEFDLLEVLLRSRHQVVSKQQLLHRVWGYRDDDSGGHLVEVHMSALRAKLRVEGDGLIQTVRGAGYVLRAP
jgi:DNA-binding response OmpR family regulator